MRAVALALASALALAILLAGCASAVTAEDGTSFPEIERWWR